MWPFDNNADHNAGYSTRSATIIKVEPLPEGTTDINTMEAGWNYVDQNKIVIYGAISPVDSIMERLSRLVDAIYLMKAKDFKTPSGKEALISKVQVAQKIVGKGHYAEAYQKLQDDIMGKIDGCSMNDSPDGNDWVKNCDAQAELYWAVHEIMVLLKILV